MALRSLVALFFAQRAVPIAASVVVHASVAAALVAGSGGHAKAGTGAAEAFEVDLVTTPAPDAPPIPEETPPPETKTSLPSAPFPTHTHPYPVPADHDARPHDPSIVHHHDDDHDHPASAPAQAAAAMTSDAPSALPRFGLVVGGNAMSTGGHVATNGEGTGGDAAHEAAPAPEITYTPSSVSAAAQIAYRAAPAYPSAARSDEVEGKVGLEIVVDVAGRVTEARVLQRAGHGFDQAALDAVRRWRFTPAQKDGRAVRVRMPVTVEFQLR